MAMNSTLRHVDPHRPRGPIYRGYAAFLATSLGSWVSVNVAWKVDPYLMRLTRSRLGMGLILPTALLESRGARSGLPRRNALIYFHDGDKVTVVASKLGAETHPGWYHNLRKNPDVLFGGEPFHAVVIGDDDERARLWTLADRVFPPYHNYRVQAARVGRQIPLIQLLPR